MSSKQFQNLNTSEKYEHRNMSKTINERINKAETTVMTMATYGCETRTKINENFSKYIERVKLH